MGCVMTISKAEQPMNNLEVVQIVCSTDNCKRTPTWYCILDDTLYCSRCAEPIGSYVRPIYEL